MKRIVIIVVAILLGLFYFFRKQVSVDMEEVNISDLLKENIDTSDLYFYSDLGSILKDSVLRSNMLCKENDVLLSKSNRGAVLIGTNDITNLSSTRKIEIELFIDPALENSRFQDTVSIKRELNKVLSLLNSGIQINFIHSEIHPLPQKTNGKINTNSLIRDIPYQSESAFIVCLFNDSEFFNTANAVALQAIDDSGKKKNIIFGNGYLLESPYLFAHELFHCLGLTHHNEMYSQCQESEISLSNVMNESNIGCSRKLSARQITIMNTKNYVPKFDEDQLFPEGDSCLCHFDGLNSEIEQYLNSFDRNIDDTPLVGDDEAFFSTVDSLKNDIFPSLRKLTVQKNYTAESKELYGDVDSLGYVTRRLAVHKKLRMYNFARWLKENLELYGHELPDDYWKLEPDSLIKRALEYHASTQMEFCENHCNGGKCPESDYFNCETCDKVKAELDENSDVERGSSKYFELRKNKFMRYSLVSKELNSFGAIIADYYPEKLNEIEKNYGFDFSETKTDDTIKEVEGSIKRENKEIPQIGKPEVKGK